jgi:prepilin-type N-terminal cleavage/methylation domain-containing protein
VRSPRARPRRDTRHDRGFTLIEILVAIVLVGVLSAVAVIGVGALTEKASGSSCTASADAATTAANAYLVRTGTRPATLRAMVDSGILELADGLSLDSAGTSVLGDGWSMTITPGPTPTFTCGDRVDTTTTTTTDPSELPAWFPVLTAGPYVTTWVNDGSELQLYVYDQGGAYCPGPSPLTKRFEVRATMAQFSSGDTVSWRQLGGPTGTLAPGETTPWTESELDGSSPYWFTKLHDGVVTRYAGEPALDHFLLTVRGTYTCVEDGTHYQRTRTHQLWLTPGVAPGSFDGHMAK